MFNLETPLEVVSVNKFKTPKAFGTHISRVCQRLVDRAMAAQSDLKPGRRSEFLEEVIYYFGPLIKTTLCNPVPQEESNRQDSACGRVYLFRSVSVSIGAGIEVTAVHEERFRKLAFQYSKAWRRAIKETRAKLRRLADTVDYFPENHGQKKISANKVIIKSTASRLALLTRIYYEIEMFVTTNKRELVRCFTQNFGTVREFDLSPVTFMNRFDRPEPATIDSMRSELQAMLDTLDQLDKRYY
jgi:hypothetical protein